MAEEMRFEDGESYESMMGVWSALVGAPFLDWLNVPEGAKWADIGCGNGASTEVIVNNAKPVLVEAIDPSEAQLAYARKRHRAGVANFTLGSALDLPYADDTFDAAIMALVLFFVPDPPRGIAEMRRVVRGGGTVGAYAWDFEGGGFPYEDVHVALEQAGAEPLLPPHADVARLDALKHLWNEAGLADVETRAITASRTFPSFADYWATAASAPGIAPVLSRLTPNELDQVRQSVQETRGSGDVEVHGRVHAVRGRVPG